MEGKSDPFGRDAIRPLDIPVRGWWQVAERVLSESSRDNLSVVAAGCAFYALFAISFYIILLGAEMNAELELQTAVDTTTGRPKPMGKRGAFVADHVAGGPLGDRRPSSPVTRDPSVAKGGAT